MRTIIRLHFCTLSLKVYVDIDPNADRPAIFTEKTWLDELTRQNDNLKQIKTIKKEIIGEVVKSFNSAIRS